MYHQKAWAFYVKKQITWLSNHLNGHAFPVGPVPADDCPMDVTYILVYVTYA